MSARDEAATYVATFACGHSVRYPLPDGCDADYLAGIARQRRCPECAYEAHSKGVEPRVAS